MMLNNFWLGFICGCAVVSVVWFAIWLSKVVSNLLNDELKDYGK